VRQRSMLFGGWDAVLVMLLRESGLDDEEVVWREDVGGMWASPKQNGGTSEPVAGGGCRRGRGRRRGRRRGGPAEQRGGHGRCFMNAVLFLVGGR